MRKQALVTGGAGFIGHHLIDRILRTTDWDVVCLDRLDTSGNLNRLEEVVSDKRRFRFVFHDLKAEINDLVARQIGSPHYIFHLAASSHVDRSIQDPLSFVMDNVVGTCNILNFARRLDKLEYVQNFSCYDDQTELYTTEGWKLYTDIQEGDIVLTLDENCRTVMQPVRKVYVQKYKGEMIRVKNRRVDLLVTPNHRMYNSNMEVVRADHLSTIDRFHLPHPEPFVGRRDKDHRFPGGDLKDIFYLVGLFIGDGFTAYQERKIPCLSGYAKKDRPRDANGRFQLAVAHEKGGQSDVICKSHRVYIDIPHESHCSGDVDRCLKNLGLKYTKPKNKSGEHYYFTSQEWSDFFDTFCKKYAYNKQIPDFMLEYDSEYLEYLLNGLIDSDGSFREEVLVSAMSYTTVSPKLSNQMIELAYKCGVHIQNYTRLKTSSEYQGRIIKANHNAYTSNLTYTSKRIVKNDVSIEEYDGVIWCVKVDNGNVLVRRNGHIIVCGNTDECFGDAPDGHAYSEWDRHYPKNPYSASKSGAENLGLSFYNTYNLPILTTNCMNVIGERQHPEKFVPLVINKLLNNEVIDIHCYPGKQRAGSRFYIHAQNVADVSLFLASKGLPGDKYNIVGQVELSNLEVVNFIADVLNIQPKFRMVDFHSNRPGHDLRYALKDTKLAAMGYKYPLDFFESLRQTVEWTVQNKRWL